MLARLVALMKTIWLRNVKRRRKKRKLGGCRRRKQRLTGKEKREKKAWNQRLEDCKEQIVFLKGRQNDINKDITAKTLCLQDPRCDTKIVAFQLVKRIACKFRRIWKKFTKRKKSC